MQIDWKFKCLTLSYLANTTLTVGQSGKELIVKIDFPQWDNQDHVNSFPVERLAEILNDFIKSDSTMQVGVESLRIDEGARTLVIVEDENSSANTLEDLNGYEIKLHHIGMAIIDQMLKRSYITATYHPDTVGMSYQFLKGYKPNRCMCCGKVTDTLFTYKRPPEVSRHYEEWMGLDHIEVCVGCVRQWDLIMPTSQEIIEVGPQELYTKAKIHDRITEANKWMFDRVMQHRKERRCE